MEAPSFLVSLTLFREYDNMSPYNMSSSDICDNPMKIDQTFPLTETTFLILFSLSSGPRHGYAIMKEVEALSEGRVLLSTGTLYGGIKRLLDDAWIERVDDPLPNDTDRQRKAYVLTDRGRRMMNAEIGRMKKLVALAPQQEGEGAT